MAVRPFSRTGPLCPRVLVMRLDQHEVTNIVRVHEGFIEWVKQFYS
jgi:hypothetical protein